MAPNSPALLLTTRHIPAAPDAFGSSSVPSRSHPVLLSMHSLPGSPSPSSLQLPCVLQCQSDVPSSGNPNLISPGWIKHHPMAHCWYQLLHSVIILYFCFPWWTVIFFEISDYILYRWTSTIRDSGNRNGQQWRGLREVEIEGIEFAPWLDLGGGRRGGVQGDPEVSTVKG